MSIPSFCLNYANYYHYISQIQHGNVNLPLTVLVNPLRHSQKIKLYKKWIYDTVRALYNNIVGEQKTHIKSGIRDMVEFEINLAKLSYNYDGNNDKISIKKLSQITRINWLRILKKLQSELKINDLIAISSLKALKKLILLVNTTKANVVGNLCSSHYTFCKPTRRIFVANYIMWSVVKEFSRDTTKHLRKLNFFVDSEFFHIKSEISLMQECINHVRNHFGFALVANYANLYMSPDTIPAVREMVHKIKSKFVVMLKQNTWLSRETSRAAVEKITGVEYLIGYPKWVENKTLVAKYYNNVSGWHFPFICFKKPKRFLAANWGQSCTEHYQNQAI